MVYHITWHFFISLMITIKKDNFKGFLSFTFQMGLFPLKNNCVIVIIFFVAIFDRSDSIKIDKSDLIKIKDKIDLIKIEDKSAETGHGHRGNGRTGKSKF
jgi:hypothetical protein